MTLDDLAAYGANVEEGLSRCMGNEAFYLRLVDKAREDGNFDALCSAVGEHRLRDAFEAAHALKGALGNLAIAPLYGPMCEITELLRSETEAGCEELLDTIMREREKLRAL